MHTLENITELVRTSVESLRSPAEPALLYDPIRYTLEAGGKRIRPILVLASAALFTDDLARAVPAAMAIEVFHNFTLLHDDIMDCSDLRRGRQTVHVKWDENVAILSGDGMLIYAYELASKSDPAKLPLILPVLNTTFMGICEGQVYDMDFEHRNDVSAEEYLRMISMKTAVLMAGSMQVGAILGHADESVARELHEAGMHLGTAFQLQDDLLDTYGDTSVLGKNTGDDIASNKKTFLLIKALERAGEKDRQELLALTSTTEIERAQKIAAVKAIYARTETREETEALVDRYFGMATEIIDRLDVPEDRKTALRGAMEMLIGRDK